MFCRYKGWNLGHMAQDKETCQFCINNTGTRLPNFNLLSKCQSHCFHPTSRAAGPGQQGDLGRSWGEPRVLLAPRRGGCTAASVLWWGREWDLSVPELCSVPWSYWEQKPAAACCRYHPCCRGIWIIAGGNSLCFSSKHFASVQQSTPKASMKQG